MRKSKRQTFVLLILSVVLLAPSDCGEPPSSGPPCECYLSADCGGEWGSGACNTSPMNGCTREGKMDGYCEVGVVLTPLAADELLSLLDLGFASLTPAIGENGGMQDATQLESMRAAAPSADVAMMVESMVYGFADIGLGFDVQPSDPTNPEAVANVRGSLDPDSSRAMLEAIRLAVHDAIDGRDPLLAEAPITIFWVEHPDYAPMHTGRCFPHGHAGGPEDPRACQIEEVQRKVSILLDLVEPP